MDTKKSVSVFGERLKKTRKQKGLRQVDLAGMLSVSIDTITRWENNLREPRASELEKIAAVLDTTVDYLLGGNEKAYMDESVFKQWKLGETDDPGREVTSGARDNQRYVEAVTEMVNVPVYSLRSCAGTGTSHLFDDVELLYDLSLPAKWVGPISPFDDRKPFLTEIDGDSMSEAGLNDGRLALVNPAVEPHSGDAALVCFGERRDTAIKWIYYLPEGAIELRSATPGFPVIRYTREQQMSEEDPLIIIGKVMGEWGEPKRG
jgi:transcriptional regulator with XRE-family HTH domain